MTVTPERWQRIVRIYELAIDQDAAAREVLLSKECVGDVSLRSEVESLLRQDETVCPPRSTGVGDCRVALR